MTINIATYEQAAEILAKVLGINLNDIDLSALGSPTTSASNNTSGNAHAKLNWILARLAEVVNTSATANANTATIINNTATANLGAPNAAASNAANAVAHAKLNWLLSNVSTFSGSVIKSVQRGYLQDVSRDNNLIPIAAINPAKALVILDTETVSEGNFILQSLTSYTIAVRTGNTMARRLSWQVIEFY